MRGEIRVAKDVGLELQFGETVLDDVADADDPLETTVPNDREMSYTTLSHERHDLTKIVVRRGRHESANSEYP